MQTKFMWHVNFIKKLGDTFFDIKKFYLFLFLSFRRVLNVIRSFLGNPPASEF